MKMTFFSILISLCCVSIGCNQHIRGAGKFGCIPKSKFILDNRTFKGQVITPDGSTPDAETLYVNFESVFYHTSPTTNIEIPNIYIKMTKDTLDKWNNSIKDPTKSLSKFKIGICAKEINTITSSTINYIYFENVAFYYDTEYLAGTPNCEAKNVMKH